MGKCQVDIPAKLHTRAKLKAVREGIPLRRLILNSLENSLRKESPNGLRR